MYRNTKQIFQFFCFTTTLFSQYSQCLAQEIPLPQSQCGLLENFVGEVQILDANRDHLLNFSNRSTLPCGSWVIIKQGWVQIRHQSGSRFQLSENSFFQLPEYRKNISDSASKANLERDHLILYKGQIFVMVRDAEEDFKISSATARARIRRGGKAIFILDPELEETQLISLKNIATLENRFEVHRRVRIEAGESTSFNLKQKRVLPSLPIPVDLASLRPKLYDLRLSDHDIKESLELALKRQERQWIASEYKTDNILETVPTLKVLKQKEPTQRGIASVNNTNSRIKNTDSYLSTSKDALNDSLNKRFIKRVTAEAQSPNFFLHPAKKNTKNFEKKSLIQTLDNNFSGNKFPANRLSTQEEVHEKNNILKKLSEEP